MVSSNAFSIKNLQHKLRVTLGAPVTRNRIYILIVREDLLINNVGFEKFAEGMLQRIQDECREDLNW